MKNRLGKIALLLGFACCVPAASASVLTFEDLPGLGPSFFLSNHNGFKFGTNSMATTAWFYTSEESTLFGPNSGQKYVATDASLYPDAPGVATQAIENATPFIFNGAWFSGSDSISYQLFSGAARVFQSPVSSLLSSSPTFIASNYYGLVTGIVISGRQGSFAMDDLTYNVAAIPEPATYALLALGLAGAAAARRHARKA